MNNNWNSISLIGYVKFPPQLKQFDKDGKQESVLDTVLKVPASYKDKDGNRVYDEVPITFWGNQAENVAKHVNAGDKLGIVGHLQSREVVNDLLDEKGEVVLNENGEPKKRHDYKQSISVDNISFMGKAIERGKDTTVDVDLENQSPQLEM